MWGGTTLYYRRITIDKCRGNTENRKSPLKHHRCCRQDPPINAKISGQKFKEKQDICQASKHFPLNIY